MGLVTNSDKWVYYTDQNGAKTAAHTVQHGEYALQYPLDLDENPEYGAVLDGDKVVKNARRVVFFINVSGNSKTSEVSTTLDDRSVMIDLPPNQYYKASGQKLKDIASAVTNGASADYGVLVPMKRLVAAISLYMPNAIANTYNVSWSEEDMGMMGMLEDTVLSLSSLPTNAGAKSILAAASSPLVAAALGKVVDNTPYLSKATRLTMGNSKAEQLFKGVDFRTFSFDYEFAPKNESEAKAVLDIIRMFRYHMLPEYYDQASFLYVYPSEFEVRYYIGQNENEHIEKQITAVLTSCNVNYTPDGQFNTFANGMPTKIRMQLQFKELAVPTKETSPYDKVGV